MREWLSGRASPCQGERREFESRLPLHIKTYEPIRYRKFLFYISIVLVKYISEGNRMNKPIIIQGALQSEINYLLQQFEIKNKNIFGDYVFYECTYKNYPVIVSKTKMGEISSAIATTLSIQKYDPLFILNQGTAGALVEWLNKEDIIIGKQIYYISLFSTSETKEIDDINPWKKAEYRTIDNEVVSYNANEKLLNWLQELDILKNKDNIYFDNIGSGDVWTKDISQMKKYNENYGVVCEAMECSGAYMAANSLKIPLTSIRAISNSEMKNQEYDEQAGELSQKIAIDIIDEFLKNPLAL